MEHDQGKTCHQHMLVKTQNYKAKIRTNKIRDENKDNTDFKGL